MGEAHHRAAVNHGSIMKSIHKKQTVFRATLQLLPRFNFPSLQHLQWIFRPSPQHYLRHFSDFHSVPKVDLFTFPARVWFSSLFFLHVRLHVPNLCVHFIGYKLYVTRYTTFHGRHCFGDLLSHDLAIVAAEISFHFGDWVLKFRWQVSRDHV